ncbi:hypothetical protein [Pseudomonas sp. Irchel 3E13]|uniref:hypothetical protein n=1 Tax=Pseudomonas sp. Irchel 3E13 TaxID=2008975 RepID=UPI000BA38019|nr:hypothetical protein [Pseudomonas sp. Irchel 3E13]
MATNSKLHISLDTMFIGCHTEVVKVPADITNGEIQDIISMRFETIDPECFEVDLSQGSRYGSHAELVDDAEEHTVEIVRGATGKLEVVKHTSEATQPVLASKEGLVFIQNYEDLHTIIAALRFWKEQGMCEAANRSDDMHRLCTNDDELTSADESDVDDLVERLNVEMRPAAFMADLQAII